MTTSVDTRQNRINLIGEAREITDGVPRDGFNDASGEFPNQDYFYGTSVNKAAKGEIINNLYSGGGEYGIPTLLPEQRPSQYPFNQVQESKSGHVIEIDDTPGGERVLVKHRSGSGLELRADGSILFSSTNNKVEITGGDHTVIVEGTGNLVYHGNLNLHVTGDYNVTVDGNYNVKTAGNHTEEIHRSRSTTIIENDNTIIQGDRSAKILKNSTETIFEDNTILVKGKQKNFVQKTIDFNAGEHITSTAYNRYTIAAQEYRTTAHTVELTGALGVIGGEQIDHFGKMFGGPPGGLGNGGTTFYGTLVGKAANAIVADFAEEAGKAFHARQAAHARRAYQAEVAKAAKDTWKDTLSADPTIGGPSAYDSNASETFPTVYSYQQIPPTTTMPTSDTIIAKISSSEYGIANVKVDILETDPDSIKNRILRSDDYNNLVSYDPTIHEIRSKLRDAKNREDSKFTGTLIAENRLNADFKRTVPEKINRSANKTKNSRFGSKFIGNNPADKKSKRFKV